MSRAARLHPRQLHPHPPALVVGAEYYQETQDYYNQPASQQDYNQNAAQPAHNDNYMQYNYENEENVTMQTSTLLQCLYKRLIA